MAVRSGMISLNGDINTGILIRTVHLKEGAARYSAGATLLYDSDPASEEEECRLKATSFFRALNPGSARDLSAIKHAKWARAFECCWLTTTIASFIRWPIMPARLARRFRHTGQT